MSENRIRDLMDIIKYQQEYLEELDRRMDAVQEGKVSRSKSAEKQKSLKEKVFSSSKKIEDEDQIIDRLLKEAHKKGIQNVTFSDLLTTEERKEAERRYKDVEKQFEKMTGINNQTDLAILVVATAMQTLRAVLTPQLGDRIDKTKRMSAREGDILVDKSKEKYISTHEQGKVLGLCKWNEVPSQRHKTWKEIIITSVPYDATMNAAAYGVNMGGGFHRQKTLGHDPLLGWIFGTVNILSDTITLTDFRTFTVSQSTFVGRSSFPYALAEAVDSINEDRNRLPAAVFKQGLHFASDKHTKCGLPVPVVSVLSDQFAGDLYRSHYDALCAKKDVLKIAGSAALTELINMIICLVHGLYYSEKSGLTRKQYEVRTRKILLISNTIAESSNLVKCGITRNIRNLDIGGILILISRWFNDAVFISKIKQEFITTEFTKSIQKQLEEFD